MLAVSILSSKYDIDKTIELINDTTADMFHIDVMDGRFVLNKFNPYEHLKNCDKPLNVHLMVSNPFEYISKYANLNPEYIIFQVEIDDDINALIDYIHTFKIKAGLAIKPETGINKIMPYLDGLDEVLVMTVEPGKGGQKLIQSTIDKVGLLAKIREEHNYKYEIGVDGGINDETIKSVRKADIITVGSFICKSDDYNMQIEKLKDKEEN